MRLDGRTVVITGASSGIGAATARAVAQRGARIVLLARSKNLLDALAEEIASSGGDAFAYQADCGDRRAVARVADAIVRDVAAPDVIVNCAGAGRWLFFDETELDEFEEMMAAPFFAAVYVTHAFLPAMIARGSGQVVNVNAPVAWVAWAGAAGYTTARWALRGFNDALRADLRGTGVTVTQVVPGLVESSYFENNPGTRERLPAVKGLLKTLSPEDVARAIVHAVEREKRVVLTPFRLRLLLGVARLFPRFSELVIARAAVRRPLLDATRPRTMRGHGD